MDKKKLTKSARDSIRGWMFVSVWVIGFLIFTIYPIFRTIKMSFDSVIISANGLITEFVGFLNYQNAFLSDVTFTKALIQYIGQIVLEVPIAVVFSLLIAIVLSKDIKGKGLMRTVFFLPVIIISGPVMEKFTDMGMMAIQGTQDSALIDNILFMLPETLSSLLSTLIDSFVMILWFCGVQILLLLSALQKMDKPMYEAAHIDGASAWESFWLITLPNLRTMIVICIVYTIVTISTFDTNPVISMIQENMFSITSGMGYASAQAWVYFFTLLLVIGFFMLIYGPKKANVYGNSKAVKQQMKEYEKVIRDQKREQRKLKRTAGKEE
jgi:ABC-type sugar transport system permease subunit